MRAPLARKYTTALSSMLLAFAFAFCGFAANTLETWFSSWRVEAGQEAPVTVRLPARYFRITMLRNEFHYLSTTSSTCPHLVPKGTRLKRGSECAGIVKAFETSRRTIKPFHLVGIFVFYFVTGLLLSLFMRTRSKGRARLLRSQLTLFGLLVFMLILTKTVLLLTALPAIVLPVVALPLLGSYFFRRQVALVIVLVSSLLTSSLINFDIEVFLVFFASGITVMGTRLPRHRAWLQLRGGAIASWVAVISTLITTLLFSGTLDIHDDLTEHFDPRYSLWLAALFGGLGSGFLSWALTPAIGWMVGEVSRSTLLDLQDLDQRLLKRMRERAPGTWEHSRAMANLAEAAANAIGGNALLARLGAYYHDMGKTVAPEYFIENQGGGPNPHDELTPIESANRIFRHVTEGTRLLRNEGLPGDVVEFCYSHHGTSVLEYFWFKNMAEGNKDNLTEKDFQYPGHKPTTRETGILMLVDAIEAAARTVDKPEKAAFQNLVQKIIFSKLSQGQLDETGLTLSDIRTISVQIIDTLVNMYHVRIKYPWQSGDTSSSISISRAELESSELVPTLDTSAQQQAAAEQSTVTNGNTTPVPEQPGPGAVPVPPQQSNAFPNTPADQILIPPAATPQAAAVPQAVPVENGLKQVIAEQQPVHPTPQAAPAPQGTPSQAQLQAKSKQTPAQGITIPPGKPMLTPAQGIAIPPGKPKQTPAQGITIRSSSDSVIPDETARQQSYAPASPIHVIEDKNPDAAASSKAKEVGRRNTLRPDQTPTAEKQAEKKAK